MMTDSIKLDSVMSVVTQLEDGEDLPTRIVVVGQQCQKNHQLIDSMKKFAFPVLFSKTGLEFAGDKEFDNVFVLDNFEDEVYAKLRRSAGRIFGPSVIIQCAQQNQPLPDNYRPLYCLSMQGLILCFTGFRSKEDLVRLADMVHHMGGSIRRDFGSKVTHLVANCTSGQKYRVAICFATPIMSEDWIIRLWEKRDDVNVTATDEQMMNMKVSPFFCCCLSFYGFTAEEQRHMEELAVSNGGSYADTGSPSCTHLVVDEHTVKHVPFETELRLHIVKSAWFWGSIQMDACADESIYKFEEPGGTHSNHTTPHMSGGKSRKRKRLRENLAQLASEGEMADSPMFPLKRRSNEVNGLSMSASFLDASNDSSLVLQDTPNKDNVVTSPPVVVSKMTARQQVVAELLQTETNYVGILTTILQVFKQEIERPDQPGGPLLQPTEIKLIFGQVRPIYEVHCKILSELQSIINNWREDIAVAGAILDHADELTKAYPPFVNFFEQTKETITECDKKLPRFHAFLKVCQTKPECGRQTLTELLICPVQRLPRIMLLLTTILKHTQKNIPDHGNLEKAIAAIEKATTYINEDKRKTEGQVVMFDIMNDIDNCPATLLSSHRQFINKVDVVELTDTLSGKGDALSLFLFSDSIEMCKRRMKVLNAKSPGGAKTPQKAYKHLEMMPLSCIKRVVDIYETADCKNVFALVTKKFDAKEKLYAFLLLNDDVTKTEMLTTLCKHISNTMYRPDYGYLLAKEYKENLLASVEATDLKIDTSDFNKTIGKAASRFGKRVSRAFSFKQTPRKLKRAMSSMTQVMSPFRRDSVYYTGTPRNDLRAMRMASINDLTEAESPILSSSTGTPGISSQFVKSATLSQATSKSLAH